MSENVGPRKMAQTIVFPLLIIISCGQVLACPPIAELEPFAELWREADYELVALKLAERRNCPYGKTAPIDYMLATSLCRIDVANVGARYFERMLASYHLSDADRELVVHERDRCGLFYDNPTRIDFYSVYSTTAARADTFDWVRATFPFGSEPIIRERALPLTEIQSRLFARTAGPAASQAVAVRLNSNPAVLSSKHFIIAASSGYPAEQLNRIAQSLETTAGYFLEQLRMPEPNFMITVYVVRDQEELRLIAKTMHGVRIGGDTIGYNYPDDLSIAAVVGGDAEAALLSHELAHLMIRNDFGDVPPWLDEGLAALVEVSRGEGSRFVVLSNWREAVLREFKVGRPSVGVLLRMDRASFDSADDLQRQALNYATARYVTMHLQATGQLEPVYHALLENNAQTIEDSSGADAVADFEALTGAPIDVFDTAFMSWFEALLPSLDTKNVRTLQTRLNTLGYEAGEADGVYGPWTTQAVRRFQTSTGLKPTGRPDRATFDALDSTTMRTP